MREIKFRGCEWNADNELLPFVYGKLCDVDVIRTNKGVDKVVHYKTVGQFTGHKDKNGVEIYEGDIISSYRGKRIVEYTPSDGIKLAIIYDEPLEGIRQTHEDFRYNSTSISSVIGNIHTTPDLLNN